MEVVGYIVGPCLGLIAAGWTFEDSRKRGMDISSAWVWAIGVFLLLIVFLPLYLWRRPQIHSDQPVPDQRQLADELVKLEELKTRGVLSEDEFQSAKQRVLGTAPVTDISREEVNDSAAQINALLQQGRKVEALAASLQLKTKLSGNTAYAEDLKRVDAAIAALSGPTQHPPNAPTSGVRVVGGLLILLGVLTVFGALGMDVSVEVPTQEILGQVVGGGRVNNLGLMNDRQNLIMIGSVLGMGGLLMTLLGGRKR